MSAERDSRETQVRSAFIATALAWSLASLAIKPFYPFIDFAVFYSTAIDYVISGRFLDMYEWVAVPVGTELPIPVNHAPLWFLYLAPFYSAGRWLGIDDFDIIHGISLGQAWMLLASLPFDLLLCRLVVRLVERERSPMSDSQQWVLIACVLGSPVLWLSSVRYGHNEALMVALTLLAISEGEKRRPVRSGLCWGLAVSIKATALVPALLWLGWAFGRALMRSGWRRFLLAGGAALGTCLLPLAPFLIFRREQIVYALAGYERTRPVGGYVLWKIADFPGFLPDLGVPLMLLAAAGIGLLLARMGGDDFLAAGGAQALVLSQAIFLMLAKSIFPWYALALGVYAFLAHPPAPRKGGASLPIAALILNMVLWGLHSGGWAAEHVSPAIRLRSALWVGLLLAIGIDALRRLRHASRGESALVGSEGRR